MAMRLRYINSPKVSFSRFLCLSGLLIRAREHSIRIPFVIGGGQITLEPGVRRSANPGMWLRCTRTGRVRVQVRLSDPAESVGWWANCLPGPGGGGG